MMLFLRGTKHDQVENHIGVWRKGRNEVGRAQLGFQLALRSKAARWAFESRRNHNFIVRPVFDPEAPYMQRL